VAYTEGEIRTIINRELTKQGSNLGGPNVDKSLTALTEIVYYTQSSGSASGSSYDQSLNKADSPQFNKLTTTVATGTAPLTVASTTVVPNLNADLLDGNHASAFALVGASPFNQSLNTTDSVKFAALTADLAIVGATSTTIGAYRFSLDATTPLPNLIIEQLTSLAPEVWTWRGQFGP
jgi:hypothetical protein